MQTRSHHVRGCTATAALIATLSLGLAPAAFGENRAAPSQPSTIERLVRQEDARQVELARYDAIADQYTRSMMLDARERAMAAGRAPTAAVARDDRSGLDPAIRTAIVAHGSVAGATASDPALSPTAGAAFAWSAAAIGLGAGVAFMCILLGCVTLVRSHGRLRSV